MRPTAKQMRTLATALLWPSLLIAQAPPADLARERADRTRWLAEASTSPARAVALTLIGPDGLTLGPEGSDIPVAGAPRATVRESGGQVTLTGWGADRSLPREVATPLRGLRVMPIGTPGRTSLLVFRDDKPGKHPSYYPYSAPLRRTVTLVPGAPKPTRTLAPDGTTVNATEVGTVAVGFGDTTVTLRVMRFPVSDEESQLLINFRDATNDAGTYPAGRFVELIPAGGDRYLLDLNRAFNPYCAYSTVFPCPIPWAGNVFPGKVEAGERYPAGEGSR